MLFKLLEHIKENGGKNIKLNLHLHRDDEHYGEHSINATVERNNIHYVKTIDIIGYSDDIESCTEFECREIFKAVVAGVEDEYGEVVSRVHIHTNEDYGYDD